MQEPHKDGEDKERVGIRSHSVWLQWEVADSGFKQKSYIIQKKIWTYFSGCYIEKKLKFP